VKQRKCLMFAPINSIYPSKMSTSNGFEQTHRVIVPVLYLIDTIR